MEVCSGIRTRALDVQVPSTPREEIRTAPCATTVRTRRLLLCWSHRLLFFVSARTNKRHHHHLEISSNTVVERKIIAVAQRACMHGRWWRGGREMVAEVELRQRHPTNRERNASRSASERRYKPKKMLGSEGPRISGLLSLAFQVARGRLRCLGPGEILRGRLRFS